jgi:hypothetical protein
MRSHVYLEDIAGIEGTRWWVVSLVALVVGLALLMGAWAVISVMGLAVTRFRKGAAAADR